MTVPTTKTKPAGVEPAGLLKNVSDNGNNNSTPAPAPAPRPSSKGAA